MGKCAEGGLYEMLSKESRQRIAETHLREEATPEETYKMMKEETRKHVAECFAKESNMRLTPEEEGRVRETAVSEMKAQTTKLTTQLAEMQAESNGRFFPMALLPWWDIDEAVREIERARKLGLRGVNINSDPHHHTGVDGQPIPDLATRHWDPLWEVCEDLNLPINFHIGASEQSMDWLGQQGWPSLSTSLKAGLGGAMLFFNNGRVMSNIIYSGALDRYPRLKFVSVESGIGWIPVLLEALAYQLDEIAADETPLLTPQEYFKRNFYGCFWFEKENISQTIRQVGVDNVLFETDYPHPTGLFPIDNLEERLKDLTEEERRKVMSLNAAKLYDIPLD